MKIPLISIIIPYYNVKKFKFTMDNLFNNSSNKYEVIIVNDYSSLKNTNELKKWEKNNIKIFNLNKNVGPSQAREYGFTKAKGEYIYFLDAGDKVLVDNLIEIVKNNYGVDIITFNFQMKSSGKIGKPKANSILDIANSFAGVWIRVFKSKLIHQDFFLKKRWFGEDVFLTLLTAQKATSFKKVEKIIYIYNNLDYGMTRKINDNWISIIDTMNLLISTTKDKHLKKVMTTRKLFQLMVYINRMRKLENNSRIYKVIYEEFKMTKGFWKLKFKYKIYYIIIRTSIYKIIYRPN